MTADFEFKDTEKTPMAPTVSIEQITIVRPIKVVALLCAVMGLFMNCLSVGSTSWFQTDFGRDGLWQTCVFIDDDAIQCRTVKISDWLEASRVLFVIGMVICFLSIVLTSFGLTTDLFHRKEKYYIAGMTCMVLAALSEMICLIIHPVKYNEELEKAGKHLSWGMGWSYGLGWIAAILMTAGAVILYIDKNADELIYREKTSYNDSIEESYDP
ncbi:unnamed protein product [Mytilus coruscus]|uniref:CACNG5 n=1 Tax=Mytilus coruscus TaxID=42192 RepID=A0A6J8AZH3_MYTCO|nr:unnamed protein product [Mytilus coruscus]